MARLAQGAAILSRRTYEISTTAWRQITEDLNVLVDLVVLRSTVLQGAIKEKPSLQTELIQTHQLSLIDKTVGQRLHAKARYATLESR